MYSEINNLALNISTACDEYVCGYTHLTPILLFLLYSSPSMYIHQFEFDPAAWSQESYEVSKDIYDVCSLYYVGCRNNRIVHSTNECSHRRPNTVYSKTTKRTDLQGWKTISSFLSTDLRQLVHS